ncbi:hypothetical protein Gasu_14510 isoform 2 [Galdieria sulphuraria]|uniref:Uncharacterized protein n=1 Tax=Galdieria sulphuraria TaxID=130081 RepID=M2Y5S2_GALSU|nr:hypothetical protein Gasu_14510 isoform 2 [Galdieria sulphuraria]EME31204.1 hypothetical protein isoform 2 [Galdieria sulphuraria]|eukprot:XP_005707724.1 hypothetical protein isoform 2 [Galdieria sulphuraria]
METRQPHYAKAPASREIFDGKRMRKAVVRRTVDFNNSSMRWMLDRPGQETEKDVPTLQPTAEYIPNLLPPQAPYMDNMPISSVCTKFVHTSINKVRCPINTCRWTPEGRRLITGASTGEFTLWNGFTFNFETILQAHDSAKVRTMIWSHDENWMLTGDHKGIVKYWQSNMNNLKAFVAHEEAIRDITFAVSDLKFATCSDDGTIKIWDFLRTAEAKDFTACDEERQLKGHGWDVRCIEWHPQFPIIASGSKDSLVKIWDAKTGRNLTTLHGHKNTVEKVRWNRNGYWLATCGRDQLIKLYDIRMMQELQTFRGHKREVTSCQWHPYHETLFVSGGWDCCIFFWLVGANEPAAVIPDAHESAVWDLNWHPIGHILVSSSNDHATKFWTRNRPGD